MEQVKSFFARQDKFARHSGIKLLEVETGKAWAKMDIEPYHLNGAGTVHGGAIFTLADFVFAVAANSHGNLAMGISTSTSFLRSVSSGTLFAEADELGINHKLATYQVRITDKEGKLVAQFQGTAYRKQESIIP